MQRYYKKRLFANLFERQDDRKWLQVLVQQDLLELGHADGWAGTISRVSRRRAGPTRPRSAPSRKPVGKPLTHHISFLRSRQTGSSATWSAPRSARFWKWEEVVASRSGYRRKNYADYRCTKIVVGRHRGRIGHQCLLIVDLGLRPVLLAEIAVSTAHARPLALGEAGCSAQQQEQTDANKSSHTTHCLNRCRWAFVSGTSSSRIRKKSAMAKKYIYCSSKSSKTTELNCSLSSFRRSSIIGFSPNSAAPARTYLPSAAPAISCRISSSSRVTGRRLR